MRASKEALRLGLITAIIAVAGAVNLAGRLAQRAFSGDAILRVTRAHLAVMMGVDPFAVLPLSEITAAYAHEAAGVDVVNVKAGDRELSLAIVAAFAAESAEASWFASSCAAHRVTQKSGEGA